MKIDYTLNINLQAKRPFFKKEFLIMDGKKLMYFEAGVNLDIPQCYPSTD